MAAIQTILHPTDFSKAAEPALRVARRLARDHGARLILLHVVPPAVVDGELAVALPQVQDDILDGHRRHLEALAAGASADCRVVEGQVVPEILRLVEEASCDLIVLGTHGRSGVARTLMGSVAEAIVHRAPCPVITIRPSSRLEPAATREAGVRPGQADRPLFPVILHPTDFSACSHHALELAQSLAHGGGRLVVLHVVDEQGIADAIYDQEIEERLCGLRPDDPTIEFESRLLKGDAAETLLHEAGALPCDLIVLGTHGRTGLNRIALGSVAESVLRRAECPVLAVRTTTAQEAEEIKHQMGQIRDEHQEYDFEEGRGSRKPSDARNR